MYIQGLNKSLGTDYGLSLPGYEASGAYPYHLLGEGGVFNFMMAASATTCMNPYGSPRSSTNLNTPGLLAISMSGRATSTLYLVFYEPGMFETAPTELDRFFTGIESASMRSAWDDPYALFASMKGVNETMRSHNDLDGGTFVLTHWA